MRAVDVVHSHSPVPAVGARLVSRTLPRRHRPSLVTTEHNVWDSHHRLTRVAESTTFGLDDVHLAVSEGVRRSLPAAKAEQVEVVVQGVDLPAVRQAADRAAVRRELGVADDDVLVGTVANLRPQKGYPDLLQAASTVVDKLPEARFVAIGQGPMEAEIAALHGTLGLEARFSLLGYRADAVRVMSGFDVFCMASHHEGLPVALMEALALGLPVVVTRVGGNAELVTDGVEGRLVEAHQPAELARALIEVVTDRAGREAMAARAADRGDELSILTSVRRHEELYRSLGGAAGG
jgi:glycosyltransferase involved in cell wall biosynthesis